MQSPILFGHLKSSVLAYSSTRLHDLLVIHVVLQSVKIEAVCRLQLIIRPFVVNLPSYPNQPMFRCLVVTCVRLMAIASIL